MKRLLFIGLALATLVIADPIAHRFELWGPITPNQRSAIYTGWTNGFIIARGDRARDFVACLEKLSNDQAVAMIDKHYRDHPERWANNLGTEILLAVTVAGGPCEDKSPF